MRPSGRGPAQAACRRLQPAWFRRVLRSWPPRTLRPLSESPVAGSWTWETPLRKSTGNVTPPSLHPRLDRLTAITTFLPTMVPHRATAGLLDHTPRGFLAGPSLLRSAGLSLTNCCAIGFIIKAHWDH